MREVRDCRVSSGGRRTTENGWLSDRQLLIGTTSTRVSQPDPRCQDMPRTASGLERKVAKLCRFPKTKQWRAHWL